MQGSNKICFYNFKFYQKLYVYKMFIVIYRYNLKKYNLYIIKIKKIKLNSQIYFNDTLLHKYNIPLKHKLLFEACQYEDIEKIITNNTFLMLNQMYKICMYRV